MSIIQPAIRLISRSEYHQMSEAGILSPTEHVELIEGQIIKMSPKGTLHSAALKKLVVLLPNHLSGLPVLWQFQDPISLENSEPEPDVAIVKANSSYYVEGHPQPVDIYLIIEIADSSLNYDLDIKGKLYAKAGIADYWVLDVNQRQLYVLREPSATGYQSQVILTELDSISLQQFPQVTFAVQALLPPQL